MTDQKWPENWTKEIAALVEAQTYAPSTDWNDVKARHARKPAGFKKWAGAVIGGLAMAAALTFGVLAVMPQPATELETAADLLAGDYLWGTSDLDSILLQVADEIAME